MIQLYPDQVETFDQVVDAFNEPGVRSVLVEKPTGTGKTVIALKVLEQMKGKMLFLVHREELMHQFVKRCSEHGYGGDVATIRSGESEQTWKRHQCAMVQTLVRRLATTQADPDVIVTDEAHHAVAESWARCYARWPEAYMLGLTGTPERLDGKGLDPPYQRLVRSKGTLWYMQNGRLAPYEMHVPPTTVGESKARITGGDYNVSDLDRELLEEGKLRLKLVPEILRLGEGRRWIAYLPTVVSSRQLASRLTEAGMPCRHVDGDSTPRERERAVREFEEGEIAGLCNVALFDEGLDVQGCDAVFLCRRTRSVVRYFQSCGRAFRFMEGKIARVGDLAGVYEAQKIVPTSYIPWSLEGKKGRPDTGAEAAKWRRCPECFRIVEASKKTCPHCGHVRAPTKAEVREAEIRAIEIKIEGLSDVVQQTKSTKGAVSAKALQASAKEAYGRAGYAGLQVLGEQLGFSSRWAYIQMKALQRYSQRGRR